MRNQAWHSAVNTSALAVVLLLTVASCAKKEKDPLDDIRAIIPKVEAGLNRRDLGGLKKLGTTKFESNAFVIDVFGTNVSDSVDLSLQRINHSQPEATLYLDMSKQRTGQKIAELRLYLVGNGRWEIDRYEIIRPINGTDPGDSL